MSSRTAFAASLALMVVGFPVAAQKALPPPITQGTPKVKRTILQRTDVPGTNLETIVARVEIQPGVKAGRHTHPGSAIGYVVEGEFFLTLDGKSEQAFKAGQSVLVPSGAIHDEGTKDKPATLIGTYVVEKGKPLAAPAK